MSQPVHLKKPGSRPCAGGLQPVGHRDNAIVRRVDEERWLPQLRRYRGQGQRFDIDPILFRAAIVNSVWRESSPACSANFLT